MNRALPALVGITLLAAACGSAPEVPKLPPRLVLEEEVYDAGRITQGTTVRHRFDVRNAGARELRLSSVRPACDCSAHVLEPQALAAGASGGFEVSLATDELAGSVQRTFTLFSNDPERPSARVIVRADVAAEVLVEPHQLYLGPISRGSRAEASLRLSFPQQPQARAVDAKSRGSLLRPEWLDAGSTGSRRLMVRLADDAPLGPFNETISVRTTHPQRPSVDVQVAGIVVEGEKEK